MREKKGNFFSPSVATIDSAKKASRYGVGAAAFSAVVTTLMATWALGAGRSAFGFVNAWAYIDAVIFAAIAYGIHREKRWCAVFGLAFFLFQKAVQVADTGQLQGAWMAILLVLCYITSIRGLNSLGDLRSRSEAPIDMKPPLGH